MGKRSFTAVLVVATTIAIPGCAKSSGPSDAGRSNDAGASSNSTAVALDVDPEQVGRGYCTDSTRTRGCELLAELARGTAPEDPKPEGEVWFGVSYAIGGEREEQDLFVLRLGRDEKGSWAEAKGVFPATEGEAKDAASLLDSAKAGTASCSDARARALCMRGRPKTELGMAPSEHTLERTTRGLSVRFSAQTKYLRRVGERMLVVEHYGPRTHHDAPDGGLAPAWVAEMWRLQLGDTDPPEKALAALRAKYDGAIRELVTDVTARLDAERKQQAAGGKKFRRIPLPPTKLAKDPNVIEIAIPYTKIDTIGVAPLHGARRAGLGRTFVKVPATGEPTVRCPSQYTDESAADLLVVDPFYLTVTVKTDACGSVMVDRDLDIARVQKKVASNVRTYLEHAQKIPPSCAPTSDAPPPISSELGALGIRRAWVTCRRPEDASWTAFSVRETSREPAETTIYPAWRTTAPGLTHLAFYVTENAATSAPYSLTLAAKRADGTELETTFFWQ